MMTPFDLEWVAKMLALACAVCALIMAENIAVYAWRHGFD